MSGRGNFFAVDRRAWAAVCGLGSINAAVSFLVMARGTLGDMKTMAWSVNAIDDRTSISRRLAKEAVERLTKAQSSRLLTRLWKADAGSTACHSVLG